MPENPAPDISYAQTAPVTCPACGHGFDFDLWLIVDAARRPDLVARIRAGTLHDVVCPQCGAAIGRADAPLLLYTAGETGRGDPAPTRPAIIFSPAQGMIARPASGGSASNAARHRAAQRSSRSRYGRRSRATPPAPACPAIPA